MDETNPYTVTNPDDISSENVEESYKKIIFTLDKSDYLVKEDIYNKNGLLIAKQGGGVNDSMYMKVLRHKLRKPIDDYLIFSDQVSTTSILDDMQSLFSSVISDMSYNFDDTMKTIEKIIQMVKFDSVMLNKLTVYKTDRPTEFDQSLSSAFIAVEIAKLLNFQDKDMVDLYCTCLLRDIGQLFVEPSLFSKEQLSQQDYKAIMVHPVISNLILKESNTHFSKQVLQAVLNHHERIDGSGYPRKLIGNDVGLFERIIAVVDTFEAMKRKDRNTDDVMWALKCNSYNQSIAGDKVYSRYDPNIVLKLEQLITQSENNKYSDQQRSELEHHVKNLFTSLNAINVEIESTIKDIDSLMEASNQSSHNPNNNLADSIFSSTQDELHKLKHSVLDSSGLMDISFDTIMNSDENLTAARRDIERIAPYLLAQLDNTKHTLSQSNSDTVQTLTEHTNSIYDKAFKLSRLVQQAV